VVRGDRCTSSGIERDLKGTPNPSAEAHALCLRRRFHCVADHRIDAADHPSIIIGYDTVSLIRHIMKQLCQIA